MRLVTVGIIGAGNVIWAYFQALDRLLPRGLAQIGAVVESLLDTFVEPDLVVYPRGLKLETVKGSDIELAIEVALTSLAYDRGVKSRLYARHRVREFWVVNATRRQTFVHTAPKGDGWGQVIERGPQETLACSALPGFALRLDEV